MPLVRMNNCDEQVMWAQHGHIQCVRNMHLLMELGHTPAMKIDPLWYCFWGPFWPQIPFFQSYLYARFTSTWKWLYMLIANWSLTLAFHIIFTRAPVNFMWAQTRQCPGAVTPLRMKVETNSQFQWYFCGLTICSSSTYDLQNACNLLKF